MEAASCYFSNQNLSMSILISWLGKQNLLWGHPNCALQRLLIKKKWETTKEFTHIRHRIRISWFSDENLASYWLTRLLSANIMLKIYHVHCQLRQDNVGLQFMACLDLDKPDKKLMFASSHILDQMCSSESYFSCLHCFFPAQEKQSENTQLLG